MVLYHYIIRRLASISSGRKLLCAAAAAAGYLLLADAAVADLTIFGYEDRLHDRFYVGNDKAFIGEAYNWSGYGRIADPVASGASNWKHLTMISDNWFITANHFRPIRGDDPAGVFPKARFYRSNDPNGDYWESELAASGLEYLGVQIGNTDLWVGKLANTPPDWVLRYPLANRHEGTNYLSYTNNELFVFGQDSPRSLSSVRVGRNQAAELSAVGDYGWDYNPASGAGRDEAQTVSGDSGAPSFSLTGRIPVLAGIHTRTNYDTGVSAHLDAIRAAVDEPISVSTGLVGDLNGDFRVDWLDLIRMALNNGTMDQPARYYQGDVDGDGDFNLRDLSRIAAYIGQTLYAPSDFNRDGRVDGSDLVTIGNNWQRPVASPFTNGDGDGNLFVDFDDVLAFDRHQRRGVFGAAPAPLSPVPGDTDYNGLVDGFDLYRVQTALGQKVPLGTRGDVDANGIVTESDVAFVVSHVGTSFGDLNGDRTVGPLDFAVLTENWNLPVGGGRLSGDLNDDGWVTSQDARVLWGWWSIGASGFPSVGVPEPAAFASMLVGAGLLCGFGRLRTRRRAHP